VVLFRGAGRFALPEPRIHPTARKRYLRGSDAMTESELQRIENVDGQVKWFDQRKGYGFIVGPEGQDIFTHYSVIEGEGFRVLKDGSAVRYDAVKTEKGWKATRVVRADPPEITVVPRRGYTRTPRR